MQPTTLIIGAGLAGMVTGLVLAKHGHNVTIVEQASLPGVLLRGFKRQGVRFETGLHYTGGLGDNGPLTRYFRYLGLEGLNPIPFDPECFDAVRFTQSGRTFCLPVGFEAQKNTLVAAFPQEEQAILAYLEVTRKIYSSSTMLSQEESPLLPYNEPAWQEPLSAFLNRATQNEELKTILGLHCLLYGVSPDHISLLQHSRIAGSYHDSVHTFEGGGLALVQSLLAQLDKHGVTILCNNTVAACTVNAQKCLSGVVLEDGRHIPAQTVVYTGSPNKLPGMLPQGILRPAFRHHMENLEDTMSALVLFGKASAPVQAVHRKNVFICQDTILAHAFLPERTPAQGPFYVTGTPLPAPCTTPCAQGIMGFAPQHASQFRQFMHLPKGKARPPEYARQKQDALEALQDALVTAIPELAPVQFFEGATPLTLKDYVGGPQGGLYGCAHSIHQITPLPATRLPNLFLAGQSVIAPGVLGVVVSAFMACGFILGHKQLQSEVWSCKHP